MQSKSFSVFVQILSNVKKIAIVIVLILTVYPIIYSFNIEIIVQLSETELLVML